MKKSYSGYAQPSSTLVAYTLDYRCPRCCSENVTIDTSVPIPFFYDGSPSTGDELSTWECGDCSHRAEGNEFVAMRIPKSSADLELISIDW
jgi:C4-type Zn-finger protein